MKKKKINDGHYLELLDRLHVISCMVEDHLSNHPLTQKEGEVNKLITFTLINLGKAYQIVGDLMYKKDEQKNPISEVVLRRRKKSKDRGVDGRKKF